MQVNVGDAITYTPVAYYNTTGQADATTVTSHGGDRTVWEAPNATDSPDVSLPFDGAGIQARVVRLRVTVPPTSVGSLTRRDAYDATLVCDRSKPIDYLFMNRSISPSKRYSTLNEVLYIFNDVYVSYDNLLLMLHGQGASLSSGDKKSANS